ncbi:hypothetical protein ABTF44_21040, partial [Acinetobacter baumannii]
GAWKTFERGHIARDCGGRTKLAGKQAYEGLRHAFQAISAKNLVNPAQNGSSAGSRNGQMKKKSATGMQEDARRRIILPLSPRF